MIFLAIALAAAGPETCDGSQQQLNECAAQFFREADAQLNLQWRKTLAILRKSDKEMAGFPGVAGPSVNTLIKAQRAWLIYREQSCETISRISGGTIGTLNYFVCMDSLTRDRTKELEVLTRNPNSDEPL